MGATGDQFTMALYQRGVDGAVLKWTAGPTCPPHPRVLLRRTAEHLEMCTTAQTRTAKAGTLLERQQDPLAS
jgi:hypothetical protein